MRRVSLLLILLLGCPPTLSDDDDDATVADDDDAVDDDDTVDDDDSTPTPIDDDDVSDDDDLMDDDDDIGLELLCDALTDDEVLTSLYEGPKVPPGWYTDGFDGNTESALYPDWGCSNDTDDTLALSQDFYGATESELIETRADRMFNETLWSSPSGFVMHLRQTRCDYWDGELLDQGIGPFWELDPLRELAGYQWWRDNHNISGHHIVLAYEFPGNATNFLTMCHISTVYGDWGVRDEVTVWQTDWTMSQVGGTGYTTGPQYVRLVLGNEN